MASTKAVLIVGGSGFVGTHLALKMRDSYKVFATYHRRPLRIPGVTFFPVNAADRNWIKRVVYTVRPDVVIYAAGSNSAEKAESNPGDADDVHTGGVVTIANIAEILSPKFIYLSNCFTFDGKKGNYHQADTILPANALGKAKVGGENFIRSKCLNYVILRSSPLYGRGNGVNLSFLDRIRMKLDRGERFELDDTEVHSFAPISGFAEMVTRTAESGLRNRTLHWGGLTKLSYFEFARGFADTFGYDPDLIVPKRSSAPSDFSLNSTQASELLKLEPLLLEKGFDLIQKDLVPGL